MLQLVMLYHNSTCPLCKAELDQVRCLAVQPKHVLAHMLGSCLTFAVSRKYSHMGLLSMALKCAIISLPIAFGCP